MRVSDIVDPFQARRPSLKQPPQQTSSAFSAGAGPWREAIAARIMILSY
jgi:hypothetical protein